MNDVRPQVIDIDVGRVKGVGEDISLKKSMGTYEGRCVADTSYSRRVAVFKRTYHDRGYCKVIHGCL